MNKVMIVFLCILFIYCVYKKINVFELYIEGVKKSLSLVIPIFTSMMAFLLFVTLLKECGLIHILSTCFSNVIPIPVELLLIGILRPISANAALSYLYTIYNQFGVDHIYSLFATLIQCSSDTTFYVVTLYFSSIHINDTRYALKLGIFMDCLAFIIAFLFFLKMIV